jgi:hypothetical protein
MPVQGPVTSQGTTEMKFLILIAAFALAPSQDLVRRPCCSIGGIILDNSGKPIVGAEIRAFWSHPPAIFTPDQVPKAFSDSNGRFSISDLSIGGYQVSARAQGFVTQSYGAKRSTATGKEILLSAEESHSDLTLKLIPAGSISGRIISTTGVALVGIDVHALSRVYDSTGWKYYFPAAPSVQTNDKGEYRLSGLGPGRYYVRADALFPETDRPVSGRSPVSSGKFEGTYYPRSPLIEGAELVVLPQGTELKSIDITLRSQQTFTIRGSVAEADGRSPAAPSLTVLPFHAEYISVISPWTPCQGTIAKLNVLNCERNTYREDGTFELKNIQPGLYSVTARLPLEWSSEQKNALRQPGFDLDSLPALQSAMAVVRVTNADVENVHLVIPRSLSLPGRVTIDGRSPSSVEAESIKVAIQSSSSSALGPKRKAVFESDGRFVIGNLSSDVYRLDLSGLPTELFVVEARLGDSNALDNFEIFSLQPEGLNIQLSSQTGQAEGLLSDSASNPVPDSQVVFIPDIEPNQPMRPDLYRVSLSDANGFFKVAAIAPGKYKACAWDDSQEESYFDPSAVRLVDDRCTPLQVVAGATVQLRISR